MIPAASRLPAPSVLGVQARHDCADQGPSRARGRTDAIHRAPDASRPSSGARFLAVVSEPPGTGAPGAAAATASVPGEPDLSTALTPLLASRSGMWITAGERAPHGDGHGAARVRRVVLSAGDRHAHGRMTEESLGSLYRDVTALPTIHRPWWDAYVRVNEELARAAADSAAPGAAVWVHDHGLQLVPAALRRLRPDVRIVYVSRTPFPARHVLARFPWHRRLVQGLLGADVLVFSRHSDVVNLRDAARRWGACVAHESDDGALTLRCSGGRSVRVVAEAPTVDTAALAGLARRPDVVARAHQIRSHLGEPRRVLLGIDRLDPVDGVPNRLAALERLYRSGRLNARDTVVIQVAVPQRDRDVGRSVAVRDDVEILVARINGDHGHLGTSPVHYLHRSLPREELAALYLAADVLTVTPLDDRASLVADEYAVSRHDERGAVVLSEFAAPAGPSGALHVNPHHLEAVQQALLVAAELPADEQARRMRLLRERAMRRDTVGWTSAVLDHLQQATASSGARAGVAATS